MAAAFETPVTGLSSRSNYIGNIFFFLNAKKDSLLFLHHLEGGEKSKYDTID